MHTEYERYLDQKLEEGNWYLFHLKVRLKTAYHEDVGGEWCDTSIYEYYVIKHWLLKWIMRSSLRGQTGILGHIMQDTV